MGVFNSVYVACPHCGEVDEEQYKPGDMQSWRFGVSDDIPLSYLESFRSREWECWSCGKFFRTDVTIGAGEMVVEQVSRGGSEP